jgi:hypothetical protein
MNSASDRSSIRGMFVIPLPSTALSQIRRPGESGPDAAAIVWAAR